MSMIDDIKRDLEAGTQGPWIQHKDTYSGSYEVKKAGPEKNPFRQSVLLARVFRPTDLPNSHPDASRIARVPDLEAALIAAERMEKFVALVDGSFGGGRVITFSDADIAECKEVLTAFRAATGAS